MEVFAIIFLSLVVLLKGSNAAEGDCPTDCSCKDDIVDCRNRNLMEVPRFSGMAGKTLKKILLNDNKITQIKKNAFSGPTVKVIDISNNALSSLSDGAFNGLSYVEELYLNDCGIDSIPKFDDMTGLKKLEMRGSNIATLTSMDSLTELEHFDMSMNTRLTIPSGFSFRDMTKLKYLNLEGCGMTVIPSNQIRDVNSLVCLKLANNQINSIPTGAFETLKKLEEIDLWNNPVQLPASHSAFRGLESMKFLKLGGQGCSIAELNDRFFGTLLKLRNLTVNSCQTTKVDKEELKKLKNLKCLDLGNNEVKLSLDMLTSKQKEQMEVFGLDGQDLTSIPKTTIKSFPALREVMLSKNTITKLPARAFADLTDHLSTVHLNNQKSSITSISADVMSGLMRPGALYLKGDGISNIEFLTKDPCKFHEVAVYLDDNPIECSCDTFVAMQKKSLMLTGSCGERSQNFSNKKLMWRLGLKPYAEYLEAAGKDVCEGEDKKDMKYNCGCVEWQNVTSTKVCASGAKRLASSSALAMMIVLLLGLVM